jgi:hypothetical protein
MMGIVRAGTRWNSRRSFSHLVDLRRAAADSDDAGHATTPRSPIKSWNVVAVGTLPNQKDVLLR